MSPTLTVGYRLSIGGLCQPTIPDLVVACPELLSGIEIEIQSPDGSQEDTDTATGTATGTDTATDTDTTESPSEDS